MIKISPSATSLSSFVEGVAPNDTSMYNNDLYFNPHAIPFNNGVVTWFIVPETRTRRNGSTYYLDWSTVYCPLGHTYVLSDNYYPDRVFYCTSCATASYQEECRADVLREMAGIRSFPFHFTHEEMISLSLLLLNAASHSSQFSADTARLLANFLSNCKHLDEYMDSIYATVGRVFQLLYDPITQTFSSSSSARYTAGARKYINLHATFLKEAGISSSLSKGQYVNILNELDNKFFLFYACYYCDSPIFGNKGAEIAFADIVSTAAFKSRSEFNTCPFAANLLAKYALTGCGERASAALASYFRIQAVNSGNPKQYLIDLGFPSSLRQRLFNYKPSENLHRAVSVLNEMPIPAVFNKFYLALAQF